MLVGPALILTTVVLACGLVVTVFSDLPSLRLFGWLSAFAMVAALVADLFILRPTAMFLINLRRAAARRRPSDPCEKIGVAGAARLIRCGIDDGGCRADRRWGLMQNVHTQMPGIKPA